MKFISILLALNYTGTLIAQALPIYYIPLQTATSVDKNGTAVPSFKRRPLLVFPYQSRYL